MGREAASLGDVACDDRIAACCRLWLDTRRDVEPCVCPDWIGVEAPWLWSIPGKPWSGSLCGDTVHVTLIMVGLPLPPTGDMRLMVLPIADSIWAIMLGDIIDGIMLSPRAAAAAGLSVTVNASAEAAPGELRCLTGPLRACWPLVSSKSRVGQPPIRDATSTASGWPSAVHACTPGGLALIPFPQ